MRSMTYDRLHAISGLPNAEEQSQAGVTAPTAQRNQTASSTARTPW